LEKRLLDEKESPTPTFAMPTNYEELMECETSNNSQAFGDSPASITASRS
jgi:hypothetical protein